MAAQAKPNTDFTADFHEISQQLEALKNKLENTSGSQPAPAKAATPTTNSLGYYCDENGCVLLAPGTQPPKASPSGGSSSSVFALEEFLSGNGWVLGLTGEVDPSGYCAMVGGDSWSVSLTVNELKDFVTALHAIRDAIRKLTADAVESEEGTSEVKVKWTTKTVTMEARHPYTGQPCIDNFRLSFTVGVGGLRLVRGQWSAEVVEDVLRTLDKKLAGFALDHDTIAKVAAM